MMPNIVLFILMFFGFDAELGVVDLDAKIRVLIFDAYIKQLQVRGEI
jgi:hypothetical protein